MLRTALAAAFFFAAPALAQLGSLTPPPGAVTETMKPLDIVEARTPVGLDTTPGDEFNVYIITEPGSYYLTEDLTAQGAMNGISVRASNVTLDLNGFSVNYSEVLAANTIDGDGASDERGFITYGIFVPSGNAHIRLNNGKLHGWSSGIFSQGDTVHVTNVSVSGSVTAGFFFRDSPNAMLNRCVSKGNVMVSTFNARAGFVLGDGAVIRECRSIGDDAGVLIGGTDVICEDVSVRDNTFHGISIEEDSTFTILRCHIFDFGAAGVSVGQNCTGMIRDSSVTRSNNIGFSISSQLSVEVVGCRAINNLGHGFNTSLGSAQFRDCVSEGNDLSGFRAVPDQGSFTDFRPVFRSCTAYDNGGGFLIQRPADLHDCTATHSDFNGFDFVSGVNAHRCVARSNQMDGFRAEDDNTFVGCTSVDNGGQGFTAGANSRFDTCLTRNNQSGSIFAGDRSSATACTIYHDVSGSGSGIALGQGSIISESSFTGSRATAGVGAGGVIRDCIFTGQERFPAGGGAPGATVERCTFSNFSSPAAINVSQSNFTVRGCTFSGYESAGLSVVFGARNVLIDGNTFIGGAQGVLVPASNDITVIRNTFRDVVSPVATTFGNFVAPILTPADLGNATNPFANYEF